MDAKYLQGFYLGDLLVEPLKGRVSGKNGEHHLPPKAAEVLVCLARHAGEIVPHEKLLECAWGDGGGSRESLSHTISEIRHALDDRASDPKYIQTLPRLGYRKPVWRSARLQPYIYGGGQLMHILGLAWSGGYGVKRKTAGAAQGLDSLPEVIGMGMMGLGGLISIIGGIMFLVVMLRCMWPVASDSASN